MDITDSPDGKLPAMTLEGQARRTATIAAMSSRRPTGPADRGLQERCITFGSPQLTAGYPCALAKRVLSNSQSLALDLRRLPALLLWTNLFGSLCGNRKR